jgi:FHA domain
MPTMSGRERWSLEVVRGREVGRRYQIGIGETPIGNTLAGAPGLDLADQESNSLRRMAGRHACLTWSDGALSIRDLESPGGTFVNRQRLLAGQARPLQPGDLIQLGGVQLEVKRERPLDPQTAVPSQPQPGSQPQLSSRPMSPHQLKSEPAALSVPFMIQGGSTCRAWDDFIVLAAQRWTLVRDELTSGRIADHLKRIGRSDLVPRPEPTETADEQLDAWLARLPTSRSSDPELDIHPLPLMIRAATPGGLIRKTVRISNVGYRLLRSTVRVEPATSGGIRLAAGFSAGPFLTIDHTDMPLEIQLPENSLSTTLGTVVVESNGGTRRLEILLEQHAVNATSALEADVAGPVKPVGGTRLLGKLVAAQPLVQRLILAPLALLLFRLVMLVAGLIPLGSPGASRFEPRLGSMALVLAAAGALCGSLAGKEPRDRAACGFTGGMVGLLAAAVGFALIRSVESVLDGWASSPLAALLLWALLGLAIALVTWVALPPSGPISTPPPEPTR